MKWFCALTLLASGLSARAALGGDVVLHGRIKHAATGLPMACTVTITDAHGQVVIENESFKSGFRCAGQFTKSLPAGHTRVRVTRGFETRAIERELDLIPGQHAQLELTLERVVDLRKLGWFSGDSHVHMLHGERTLPVDFDFVALSARAEDLQYLSLAQAWTLPNPTPENLDRELRSRSMPDCQLTWNLEAPKNYYQGDAGRCLGHCWNLGMRGRTREGLDVIRVLLDASAWDYESAKPTFANFESHQLIHAQGGAVFYSHPERWWLGPWGGQGGYPRVEQMRVSNMAVELPLDTLLGPTFDGLDVITTASEYAANAKAFELWAMLLNHGYRLAATASSDACFDRPGGAVPGGVRTYAYIPGGFSLEKATSATAQGHTFVTSGPLLLATIDKKPPGTSFAAGRQKHVLNIQAWAAGNDSHGLAALEILRNGNEWMNIGFEQLPRFVQTNVLVQESSTAWYCARVSGSDRQRQRAVSGAFYFADKSYQAPSKVQAKVHVRILDALSGKPLDGTVTEVQFEGTIPRPGRRRSVKQAGDEFVVPGTVRLRAESKGYAPMTLSPILNCPELIRTATHLNDRDLLDWNTFGRLEQQLAHIELRFALQPN